MALKVIRPDLLARPAVLDHFFREARAAARLVHPNAAVVYHFGVVGDTHFYAMEFIPGDTLEALMRRDGPLGASLAHGYVRQVARVLRAAHRRGIVHRDLKPANLLLHADPDDGEQVVKVIDFGLARLTSLEGEHGCDADAAQSSAGFVGTPFFASPEQAAEGAVDIRSDIYSLGATWWFFWWAARPSGARRRRCSPNTSTNHLLSGNFRAAAGRPHAVARYAGETP